MDIVEREMCEGVTLSVIPFDKQKFNFMLITLAVPLRKETATHYSLLTKVLSRCCEEFPTLKSFNIALEELYAADLDAWVHRRGEVQYVCFRLSCMENEYTYDGADVLAGAMRLLGCMVFKPLLEGGVFPSRIIEAEKKNLKEEIESIKEDKEQYAIGRCIYEMCKNEAFSTDFLGDTEVLEGLDGADVKECYDRILSTAPVNMFFAGRADAETVFDYCRRYLPFAPRKRVFYDTEVKSAGGEVKTVTERADVAQSKLCLGFRTSVTLKSDDFVDFLLGYDVLGAPWGKLFSNVREKLGLCYYCGLTLDPVKGVVIVSAGINGRDREKAERAILEQIEELKNCSITDAELASAKAGGFAACVNIRENPGAFVSWYSRAKLQGLDMTMESWEERIKKASKESIAAAMRTLTADTFYMLEGEEESAPE